MNVTWSLKVFVKFLEWTDSEKLLNQNLRCITTMGCMTERRTLCENSRIVIGATYLQELYGSCPPHSRPSRPAGRVTSPGASRPAGRVTSPGASRPAGRVTSPGASRQAGRAISPGAPKQAGRANLRGAWARRRQWWPVSWASRPLWACSRQAGRAGGWPSPPYRGTRPSAITRAKVGFYETKANTR
jgi:hypothetical protein